MLLSIGLSPSKILCHLSPLINEIPNKLTHLPLDEMADTFADDILKRIFVKGNVRISIQFSLKFVPRGSNDNKSASVQVMARGRNGDKPFPEQMLNQFNDAYMPH